MQVVWTVRMAYYSLSVKIEVEIRHHQIWTSQRRVKRAISDIDDVEWRSTLAHVHDRQAVITFYSNSKVSHQSTHHVKKLPTLNSMQAQRADIEGSKLQHHYERLAASSHQQQRPVTFAILFTYIKESHLHNFLHQSAQSHLQFQSHNSTRNAHNDDLKPFSLVVTLVCSTILIGGGVNAANNWKFDAEAVSHQEVAVVPVLGDYVSEHFNNCSTGNVIGNN
ncbi:hypothetical protein BKA57DRAFT_519214 [Linnemannia elongata]|nr:hypothetical protein BKA57DRAFT_519214 [Linnemannia elongata]